MRVLPDPAREPKGSLKWIQRAVARRPDLIQPQGLSPVRWLSPLADDRFAEYRDAAFLGRLGLDHLAPALADFWPMRGPQWDALGLAAQSPVLVEAKAHLREFHSPPSQARERSLARIRAAFARVHADIGIAQPPDWTRTYYQYANRLAHLWWLRRQGVDAHLLFVSFLGDTSPGIGGPSSPGAWTEAFARADSALGLPSRHALSPFIHHLAPSVTALS